MIGMNYIHQKASHTENYVDLTTGAYSQTIKSFWHIYKMQAKRQCGTRRILVDNYLCEFVRRQRYLNTGRELFTTCTKLTLVSKTGYKGLINPYLCSGGGSLTGKDRPKLSEYNFPIRYMLSTRG